MKLVSPDPEPGKAARSDPSPLLARVRAVLETLDLDCRCRDKLGAALERFEILEARRQLRGLILDARHQAERIAALLELVGELDTLTAEETDLSVFAEIARLFEDIRDAAARGAADMITAEALDPGARKSA
ncbi:hypothetical protein [Microvirga thermotolerans]|uniref:Uncharacterized protein n=1 Tax=Microvirga thermotolerans TaxID=2651334 RepID=A0A5P9JRV4_9HYPH|nr:hypothetical protein [Microvirga thermotolerans]QFU14831.1 hypothetical protein GDR74_00610 [Microvirga thermotolerans]